MRILAPLKAWLGFNRTHDAARQQFDPAEAHADDPFNPFPDPVRLEIRDVFDLHTINPREVRGVVEEYLREAYAARFAVVRIIHGKGTGVQREVVRGILARTTFVIDWTDAPPEAGGWGATIARFSAPDKAGEEARTAV